MSIEDFKEIYEMATNGEIGIGMTKQTIDNLRRSNSFGGTTKEEIEEYNKVLLGLGEDNSLLNRVKDFYNLFSDKSVIDKKIVSQYFSDLPPNLREAILSGAGALAEEGLDDTEV
jgi:hypothetical protein